MGALSGSREPSPSVSALTGFDPARVVLEHYSDKPVREVRSCSQEIGEGEKNWHWRGKPRGFWVSVKGEDDWPAWCNVEQFGTERLGICHRIILKPRANILHVSDPLELECFDERYGRDERLTVASTWDKRLIDWAAVASEYDGILIAPYIWEHRLDGRISDWYYGWDCASGVIWNADAIGAIAMETQRAETENTGSVATP